MSSAAPTLGDTGTRAEGVRRASETYVRGATVAPWTTTVAQSGFTWRDDCHDGSREVSWVAEVSRVAGAWQCVWVIRPTTTILRVFRLVPGHEVGGDKGGGVGGGGMGGKGGR